MDYVVALQQVLATVLIIVQCTRVVGGPNAVRRGVERYLKIMMSKLSRHETRCGRFLSCKCCLDSASLLLLRQTDTRSRQCCCLVTWAEDNHQSHFVLTLLNQKVDAEEATFI